MDKARSEEINTNVIDKEYEHNMKLKKDTTQHRKTIEDIILKDRNAFEGVKMNGKGSMSNRLPPDTYLFCPPNRYIFSGAEVYEDDTESLGYSSFSDEDSDDYNDNPEEDINLDKKPETGTEIEKGSLNGTSQ